MKKIFLLAAAAIALTACSSDDNNYEDEPIAAQITATIGEGAMTRASGESWAAGDKIGITMILENGNSWYENMEYITTAGDGQFAGTTMYFKNKREPVTLTAYYPFASEAGIITTSITAASQPSTEQPKIDFLYAKEENVTGADPNVAFRFSHVMSKLTLTFNNGIGMDVSKITSYEIAGLVMDGSFNTSTGECTANGEDASLIIETPSVSAGEALPSLILFPQSTANKTVKLKITADQDQHYEGDLSFKDNALSGGNNYNFTVTVGKTGLMIGSATIENWTDVDSGSTTAQ